jgi:hypothetical protein
MDTHLDPYWSPGRQLLCQNILRDLVGSERVTDATERRRERVAGSREHIPTLPLNSYPHNLVMTSQRQPHRSVTGLPQPRRPLDVAEQKRHRPLRRNNLNDHRHIVAHHPITLPRTR